MACDYWNLPRHPVSAKKFEMRGRNTILSHYHYRVDPELGKRVCAISRIPCAFTACVDHIDKYWLPTISRPSQTRYSHVENCNNNKIL